MGGVAIVELLKSVKDAPAKLTKRLDNLASALQRVKAALKSKFNWSDAKIDKYDDAIAKTADADDIPNGCNAECVAGKFGCFTANTDVKTPNAYVKADQVREGMLLQSFNHQTQKEEANKVSVVKKRLVSGLLLLTLSSGEVIETTPNHPFYVHQKYEDAEKLLVGDTLFTNQKLVVTLTGKVAKDTTITVYNFTVEGNNNYFVGQTNVLVHNANCFLDNLEKKFPALLGKFDALTPELQTKFLRDFSDADDAFLAVLETGKSLKAWEKFSFLAGPTKIWISKSKALLKRINDKNLTDADIEKLSKYYDSHQMPSTRVSDPPFTHNGVDFDDFGHPKFESFVPKLSDGQKIKFYASTHTPSRPNLSGNGSDMTAANNWAKNEYGDNFIKNSNGTCQIKNEDGNWIECVWHHHEDGRTLMPVPTSVHNRSSISGAPHTGGASIIDNGIQDFFSPPNY